MPTEEENVQYLYLILTHGGAPVVSDTMLSCFLSQPMCATLYGWMN
jgi:hypothetical protein